MVVKKSQDDSASIIESLDWECARFSGCDALLLLSLLSFVDFDGGDDGDDEGRCISPLSGDSMVVVEELFVVAFVAVGLDE